MIGAVLRKESRRVVNLTGGAVAASQTLKYDVSALGRDDIRRLMLSIVERDVAAETAAGNPPSITEVDGNKMKPASQAQKKIIVLFGVQLPVAALRTIEGLLMDAIAASTTPKTGRLGDPSSWEWRHIRSGRTIPIAGSGSISFGPRDFLVLRPRLGYASAANKRVASGERALTYNPAKAKRVAKRNQGLGFMAMAARACRQVPDLVPFSVTVGMTTQYPAPGEVRNIGGTAYLLVAPRRRRGIRR